MKPTFVTLTQRVQKPVLVALVVALGLALGGGGAVVLSHRGPHGAPKPVPSATHIELPASVAQPGPRPFANDPPPVPAIEPETARDALAAFFQSEVDKRADAAYALITSESRRHFPSLATWETDAVDRLVPLTYQLGGERPATVDHGQAVDIDVSATHVPALDSFSGLVPGRARETWRVWREDSHWRVDPDPVNAVPVLPFDDKAEDVVRAWVTRVQACDEQGARAVQLSSLLYGPIQLGDAPCKERGSWQVGDTETFNVSPDDGAYVAAFGPGIGSWGRLVPVTGPRSHFLVAVGPLGDDWRVLGVLVDGESG